MNLYIGIDPGINGGIAFIPSTGPAWAHKMPETDRDIYDLLRDSVCMAEPIAALELVHSSPQMGVKAHSHSVTDTEASKWPLWPLPSIPPYPPSSVAKSPGVPHQG